MIPFPPISAKISASQDRNNEVDVKIFLPVQKINIQA